jgi:hypothetical protein
VSLRREAAGRGFEARALRRRNALQQDRQTNLRRCEPAENRTIRKDEYFAQKSREEEGIGDANREPADRNNKYFAQTAREAVGFVDATLSRREAEGRQECRSYSYHAGKNALSRKPETSRRSRAKRTASPMRTFKRHRLRKTASAAPLTWYEKSGPTGVPARRGTRRECERGGGTTTLRRVRAKRRKTLGKNP